MKAQKCRVEEYHISSQGIYKGAIQMQ